MLSPVITMQSMITEKSSSSQQVLTQALTFFFCGFMFKIHDLQYLAKALRQFCSPTLDRNSIIKSSAYKRRLNLYH